jgi:FixJ family two-component response regulator
MSASAKNQSNTATGSRLMFEHVDHRGRVRLLPLSRETQKLFTAGMLGPQTDAARGRPAATDIQNSRKSLTAREWQVFDLLISGLSSKQMGFELSISPRTVEIHRAHLLQKMGVRNTASLIRVAMSAA